MMNHTNQNECRGGRRRWWPAVLAAAATSAWIAGGLPAWATPPPQPGKAMPDHVRAFVKQHGSGAARGWKAAVQRARQAREAGTADRQATAVTGTLRVPVVLVGFANQGIPAVALNDLETELFNGPWSPMTLTEYYDEISYGQLTMTGDVLSAGNLSQNDTYYEGNGQGLGGPPAGRIGELISEAIAAIDGTVNFGMYDNDGPDGAPNSGDDDGFVDLLAVVHPEIGGECLETNTNIWSHRWTYSSAISGAPLQTGDLAAGGGFIRIDDYSIQPALTCDGNGLVEIGVFCHEFGHVLGLPDLYDTDGSSSGIGHWGLMGAGNWNQPDSPAHMGAWSKTELGWVLPTLLTDPMGSATLPPVETNPVIYKIYNEQRAREYFLIENRQPLGSDVNLHTPGLAIWHIDARLAAGCNLSNSCNQKEKCGNNCPGCPSNYSVALEQADGACDLEAGFNRGDDGDLFPGSSGNSQFDSSTTPNSKPYGNSGTDVSIHNIGPCNGQDLCFDFDAFPLPQAAVPALDVVFLIDVSGSYFDDLSNYISPQMPGIVGDVLAAFPDTRFGLASFRDFPMAPYGGAGDFAYTVNQSLSVNTATFFGSVAALQASGGSDLPESQYEAIYQLMTGSGRDLNNDGVPGNNAGEISPMPMNWQSGRTPVIYLLTDAPFHNSDWESYPGTTLEAVGRTAVLTELANPSVMAQTPILFVLNADHAGPTVVSPQGQDTGDPLIPPDLLTVQSEELADVTGGAYLPSGPNTALMRAAVRISLEVLGATYPEIGDCCAPDGCVSGVTRSDCINILGGFFDQEIPQNCVTDLNGDGVTGPADLAALLGAWGPCESCAPADCSSDFNGDCTVGPADLAQVLGAWGPCSETLGCVTDAQCDDGLFCNGAETCDEGHCRPGIPAACNDGLACSQDFCSEVLRDCEYVYDDGLCEDGVQCSVNRCVPGVGCVVEPTGDPCCGDGIVEGFEECDPPNGVTCDIECQAIAGQSNCCAAHAGTGCDDDFCAAVVCGVDDFCCAVLWDEICAALAAGLCGEVCN